MLDKIDDVDNEGYVPACLIQDQIEGRFQQRYEVMLKRREIAGIYHTCHGHCNNRQTVLNLQAKGIECNHLKRYNLAHKCDACDAAPGRRHHKMKVTTIVKRKTKSTSKTVAPVVTAIATAFDSQIHLQNTSIWNSAQSQMPLTPLLRSLNSWHVFFSTRQRNLVTILTLLRCVICQTLRKTLPILALVKALQQAPILQHHFSHNLAQICAWIGGMPAV